MSLFNVGERRTGFTSVHNPFNNPTIPLSSVGLDEVFGSVSRTDSGESVTQDIAMQIPTVYRCVGLLATVIAGCPVRTFRENGKEEVFPKLLDRGNRDMVYTQYELWELVVTHIALWGNAYVRKLRAWEVPTADGRPRPAKNTPAGDIIVDLVPINPDRVDVELDEGSKIFKVERLRSDGTLDNSKPPLVWTTYEVMHIPGEGYNGVVGMSPIEYAARTFGTSIASDKLAARFYAKGTLLTGVLNVKAPLANQKQADEIRRRWIQKNGGINATAEVAVLDAETTFQPLVIEPEALQFLQSRRWQTTEIARMYGIPPHLVGDVEKSTSWGTGIEQQNVGFVSYTISGWTNRIEQRITREVVNVNKQYCEFDLDRLMRGSMQERFNAYATAIQWGWLTRNEARIKENMNPLKGLNKPLTPLNMQTGNPNDTLGPKGDETSPTVGKGQAPKDDDD